MKDHFLKTSIILLMLLLLNGCVAPYVQPPQSALSSSTTIYSTGHGAALGAIAGLPAEAVAPATAIGAVVGAGVGSYMASTPRMLKILQKDGVQVVQVGNTLRVIIPSDALFAPGSTLIEPDSYHILDDVVMFLKRYGDVPMRIYAFTDSVYDRDTALRITSIQARRVSAYLWNKGRPFYHLIPKGMGQGYPIASNGNPRGSAFNRRIEIIMPILRSKPQIFKGIAQTLDLNH